MLAIQIGRIKRRKEYLVLVDSKKGEGRKKDVILLNQKDRKKEYDW